MIIDVNQTIIETVRELLAIARSTLEQYGSHLPTAIVHTVEGMIPIVLPFKDDAQKKALVDYVKKEAVERHSYAVTTITSARIVDARTGQEQECLVLATSVQGGPSYVVVQHFSRKGDEGRIDFGEVVEGEDAQMPGQMTIFPDWDEEVCH
jgi:hypothetical protein